ncbi:hypothetical protein CNR22_09030 [Sphingobacteriaceae bacterium]|nr:hypothetical protein CNR22_09030 [Sphingobacteriaceae bacterium]
MTKLKTFINFLFYIGLTSLGVFIAFTVSWTNGSARFFGILAFFLVGFGSLFGGVALTRLIIPCEYNYNLSTLSNSLNYKELKNKVGRKIHLINITYISLFLFLFVISSYSYITLFHNHEFNQLKKFGQTQKVVITKTGHLGKGSSFAFFDFYFNDKKYSDHLSQKHFSEGDSETIIFSTQDPDIIEWVDDFDPNSK